VVIVLVCAKLAAEGLFGWQLVDWQQQAGFVSLTLSHVIGAGTGLLIWLIHIAGDARGAGTNPAALVDH
jgi:hypothetical protein